MKLPEQKWKIIGVKGVERLEELHRELEKREISLEWEPWKLGELEAGIGLFF